MTVVTTVRNAIWRSFERLRQINLNQVPTWAKSASRTIRDKEEAVYRKKDGGMESSASSGGNGDRWVIGIANRDGGPGWNRSNRKR
jgi:hypothetical protein